MASTYKIAVNMEFVRSADKSFQEGIKIASELGYKYVEPMVHTGWELLSEVNYFHSFFILIWELPKNQENCVSDSSFPKNKMKNPLFDQNWRKRPDLLTTSLMLTELSKHLAR